MSPRRLILLTGLAMLAFAGNSLLCRAALAGPVIDAASFTTLRLVSGTLTLYLILGLRGGSAQGGGTGVRGGNWWSALALFAYAAGFSFAYISLSAGIGALLLFGAVQATMIAYGLVRGERLNRVQVGGLVLALAGLVGLLSPGLQAPPLLGSVLMLGAGVAWGVYSLRGRGGGDPTLATAGNFLRAAPLSLLLSLLLIDQLALSLPGIVLAVASGALASGVGYAIWYTALPGLRATSAATVQLSVPALAAFGGVLLLDEVLSVRLLLASIAILGGIAVFILYQRRAPRA